MNSAVAFVDELLDGITITPEALRQHIYIIDKYDELVLYKLNRAQLHLEAHLTGRDLIIKSRQIGFSTFFIVRNTIKAMTQRARIGTMAHDSETTQKLRRMSDVIWQQLPNHIRPERGLDNAKTTSYKSTGSEVTIATAGSKEAGIGGTYPGGFHGSEVSRWKNAKGIIGGMLQGVPMHAPIVLETTANGAQGLAYEYAMQAIKGEGIWTLHFYQWWWVDEYCIPLEPGESLTYTTEESLLIAKHALSPEQIKWRRYKILELGDLFLQEYPEDIVTAFLTSGRGVFSFDMTLFYDPPEAPEDGHEYVMGVDWGQSPDSTCASVWDATDFREVAILHTGKREYDSMIEDIVELAKHWGVSKVRPESNSIGHVTVKMLRDRLRDELPDNEYLVTPLYMTNRTKDNLVKMFMQGMKDGFKLINHTLANHELRIFQASQTATGLWTYSHPSGQHDDTVIARLLAHFACYRIQNRI